MTNNSLNLLLGVNAIYSSEINNIDLHNIPRIIMS